MKDTKIYGVARKNKQEIKRVIKFAIVGFSGLIVDFTILNILAHVFNVDSWLAIAIAFIFAAFNNFVWNRLWVYPESRSEPKRKQLPVFMAVNAMGLGINELILFLFEIPMTALLHSDVLGLNVTKAIAAVIVMFWNFIINRLVTFRMVKLKVSVNGHTEEIVEPLESAL
jgi:putative flippase GtrA